MGLQWDVVHQASEDNEGKYGCTSFNDQTIYINPRLTKEMKEQTFLHELIHVIWWQMGIDKIPGFNQDLEEPIVNQTANGLYAAIKAGLLK